MAVSNSRHRGTRRRSVLATHCLIFVDLRLSHSIKFEEQRDDSLVVV